MQWNETGSLWVSVRPVRDALHVRVVGDLDLFTAGAVRDQVCASMTTAAPVLEVDLSECAFIDSAGIHVLLQLKRAAQRCGGNLEVVSASPQVHRVIGVAALLREAP